MPALRLLLGISLLALAGAMTLGVVGSLAYAPDAEPHIPPVTIDALVEAIRDGRGVVFVDVRERGEYQEFHIPGAVHFPVRELTEEKLATFEGAAYVVPYCLKDFRGFEGAKRLRGLGVENVRLIEGFGIKAWREAALPVAGVVNGKTDAKGLQEIIGWRPARPGAAEGGE